MSTYVRAVPRQDKEEAIRLYIWNIALSSAFYGMLQILEVTLRNAMHGQLAANYGPAWYDNQLVGLDDGGTTDSRYEDAVDAHGRPTYITRSNRGWTVFRFLGLSSWTWGRIAELNRRANYEMTLWRPVLHHAFPHARSLTRKQAHAALDRLRTLRNRIAHHEPIFAREHTVDYDLILEVTGWISPTARQWLDHHNRVHALLDVPWRSVDVPF